MTEPQTLNDEILAKSSKGVGHVPIDSVYIPESRVRRETDRVRNHIENDLAPSIAENGCIQPPVLLVYDTPREIDGKVYTHELIAGWCRTQAFILLGCTHIPYNTRESLRKDQLQQLEIEENFTRLDMTWQEYCMGIASTHRTKQLQAAARGDTWTQKQTGKLVGGYSHAHIGDCLKLDERLRAGDKEIWAASSVSEAQKILLGRKEDELLRGLAQATGAVPAVAPIKSSTTTIGPIRPSSGEGFDLSSLMSPDSPTAPDSDMVGETPLVESMIVDLSKMLFNMDNMEFFKQCDDQTFDLIYTDIPYGIDMDNLDFNADDLDRVRDEHDVEENVAQMRPFLNEAFRVLKDNSYCLFWYDIKHQEKLVNWGREAGFKVQPWPLIWNKLHPCRNRSASTWWTKSIEYCMVMRKGTATLRKPQLRCVFDADGSAERKMQRNPFAKPFELSKKILEPLLIPGMSMLDPYAGEGSLVRAGLNLGLRVTAVEKSDVHFPGLVQHVKDVYNTLTRNKVQFV